MTDHDEGHDPLGVDHDHEKRGPDLEKEGPPVAQLASTYGSSFVTDADQAARIGQDATPDPDDRSISVENQDGPTPPG